MNPLYIIRGKVKKGMQRGKNLGFPTVNISLHTSIPEGIYAATVKINKQTYHAATFIGAARTFGEKDIKAESYILDFDQNIYGMWVTIQLYKKIRDNKKFNSSEKLVKQINKDIEEVKQFFDIGF